MPRHKKPGGPEPKTRSRNGCWPCKNRKIKCGEEKPQCLNCERQGETCDYSIRLNWEGRTKRKAGETTPEPSFVPTAPSSANIYEKLSLTGSQPDNWARYPLASPPKPENQGSQGPLASIEEYKRKLQYTPEDQDKQLGDGFEAKQERDTPSVSTRPVWIDPALTDETSLASAGSGNLTASKSPRWNNDLSEVPAKSPRLNNNASDFPVKSPRWGCGGAFEPQVAGNKDPLHPQLSRVRGSSNPYYPSPSNSNADSPPPNQISFPSSVNAGQGHMRSTSEMLPPFHNPAPSFASQMTGRRSDEEASVTSDHLSKRMRLSPSFDQPEGLNAISSPQFGLLGSLNPPQNLQLPAYSPSSGNIGVLPTPASSSVTSEDAHRPNKAFQLPQESPDIRRLSVKSLLSDDSPADSGTESVSTFMISAVNTPTISYGVDRGFPDRDLPNNNDAIALNVVTPSLSKRSFDDGDIESPEDSYFSPEFGFGLYGTNSAHDQGGYYSTPVTVTIPRGLTPLPPTLQDNPMNLLYFHHFLNHTARILVPHDCSANPFKSILPQMAVQDINLLHLLLAYSASHRALLLKHPEPVNRIALWVKDVFPTLRCALLDPNRPISNANLATAIMLASLEIISPNAFEVTVPWQNHLNVARRMILSRGGAQAVHRKDKVSYFLSRWFAYLDVLGSLSGSKNEQPLFSGSYWINDDSDDEFQIDCLLGFTSQCVGILAKIAELASQCDRERIDAETREIREDWTPGEEIVQQAEQLKQNLQNARMHRFKGCPHRPSTPIKSTPDRHIGDDNNNPGWDLLEMVATNEAFHWAGLVHLNRRILGKKSEDIEVQIAVREIVSALFKVRKGGTAETCLLFPMFTAGCDAKEPGQREVIMERVKWVEGCGMTQVHKARRLIEKVWETGKPWETLVAGEFFG
ncbi:MAG: hypothetical protein Q9167_005917 [Letrouitia subvulpina]